ncbi:unnamed protein product [Ixodes hexagonus]
MSTTEQKITTTDRTLSHALESLSKKDPARPPSRADSGAWEGDRGDCNKGAVIAVALIGAVIVGIILVVKGMTPKRQALFGIIDVAALNLSKATTAVARAQVDVVNGTEYAIVGV